MEEARFPPRWKTELQSPEEAINLVAAIFSHLRSPANCGRAGDTRGKGGEGRRSIVGEGRSIAGVYIRGIHGFIRPSRLSFHLSTDCHRNKPD